MANSYHQIYLHLVFAVKNRYAFIPEKHRELMQQYICGIISNLKCQPLAIYCNPDHTHLLIAVHPSVSISYLIRDIKAFSSKYMHEELAKNKQFMWQDGYGAFSYSRSQISQVAEYIHNQAIHHKKVSFRDEYIGILEIFGIEYDERYLF